MSNFLAKDDYESGVSAHHCYYWYDTNNRKLIPHPHTLLEYDTCLSTHHIPYFSSFTYLIGIVRILGASIGIERFKSTQLEAMTQNIDASLEGWKSRLSPGKRDVMTKNGEVDEVLFQAHVLAQTYVETLLHISTTTKA